MTLVILPTRKLEAWLMRPWTVDDMEKAYALKAMGRPYSEIAGKLDRSAAEVQAAIHEAPE